MSDSAASDDYPAGEAPYSLLSRRAGFGTPSFNPLVRAVVTLVGRGIGHLRTVRDRRAMVERWWRYAAPSPPRPSTTVTQSSTITRSRGLRPSAR